MTATRSLSPLQLRFRRFRRIKRGFYAFCVLLGVYMLSLLNPLLVNNNALLVCYRGSYYFPLFVMYRGDFFGQTHVHGERNLGEADYRELKKQFAGTGEGNWVLLPLYPYHPNESLLHLPGSPPIGHPDRTGWGPMTGGGISLPGWCMGFERP